ncbi:MAG: leucine-rich repeat protein [Eubacterium sp.]
MKKVLSIILSVVMLLSITAGFDLSAYADSSGDFEYEVLGNGTAEITEYTGSGGNVTIPSKLDGYTVTSIGECAFWCCEEFTGITIPNSVTSIGYGAFGYCKKLASITIPNSVKTIKSAAFIRCESLKNITIPNGVTSIETNTFYFCSNLKNITIPESVTSIGEAFVGCKSFTSITIPKNVKSVDGQAFDCCENLSSINVDSNNKNYISMNGVLYNKNKTELIKYPEGKSGSSFIIPNSVTSIGIGAFSGCTSLTSVTIPNSVTRIGDGAFNSCIRLTNITIPEKVKQISPFTFSNCKSLTSIKVHKNNKIYTSVNGVLYSKNKTQLIRFPEGKNGSFTIPNTVTSIGESAFYSCDSLTDITIPESVTSIGGSAFDSCKKLTRITIPKNVKRIESLTFYDCNKLKDITILGKDVDIEEYAVGYIHDSSIDYGDFAGGFDPLPVKDCKIRGYKNSTAEKYAKNNGFKFTALIEASALSVSLSSTSYTYNGKVKKPTVTVKDSKGNKIASSNYTVSYSSGRKNVGTYTVTIKFKGNYGGTIKKTFTIKPKATTISSVTAKSKGFTVKWKKLTTQTTGYQIQYSTSRKFTNAKTVTVSKNSTTSKTISKLSAKKKYYVRVRTYKTVDGKKIYSAWSSAKSVTTKK